MMVRVNVLSIGTGMRMALRYTAVTKSLNLVKHKLLSTEKLAGKFSKGHTEFLRTVAKFQ
jgi:hypothetical protein